MHDTDGVAAKCGSCQRQFVVGDEPKYCPHCGSDDVAAGFSVVVRPH